MPASGGAPVPHGAAIDSKRFLLTVVTVVAAVELLAMMILAWVIPWDLPAIWEALADTVFLAGVSGPILWWLSIVPLSRAIRESSSRAEAARQRLASELAAQEADARITRALDMAERENEIFAVIERTLAAEFGDHRGELLMADSSRAHLRRVLSIGDEPPGCPATSPHDCVAVRHGQIRTFESSEAIDACPKLQNRPDGPVSAICTPIAVLGQPVGVLHLTGAEHAVPVQSAPRLGQLVSASGARLGMLRALADSELQAATDPLTGLANRRTIEARLNSMKRNGQPYALLMADLDHFKTLNDTYGHETGDRALRLFARVLNDVVRAEDLAGRFGGEEFLCLVEGGDEIAGVRVAERIRRVLRELLSESTVPSFTVSIGVSAASAGADPAQVIQDADAATYEAKRNGRDRVEAAVTMSSALPQIDDPEEACEPAAPGDADGAA